MGLKDRWDEAQLKELHRELSLLLSPFGTPEDFQIDLNTGGTFTALDGIIEPPEELLEQGALGAGSVDHRCIQDIN